MLIDPEGYETPHNQKSDARNCSRQREYIGVFGLVPQQTADQAADSATRAEAETGVQGLTPALVSAGKKAVYQRNTDRMEYTETECMKKLRKKQHRQVIDEKTDQ